MSTIDEAILETTLTQLNDALRQNNSKRRDIESQIRSLESIQMVEEKTEQGTKIIIDKVLPKDREMGETIKPARRQEIYDKVMVKAQSILGGTP